MHKRSGWQDEVHDSSCVRSVRRGCVPRASGGAESRTATRAARRRRSFDRRDADETGTALASVLEQRKEDGARGVGGCSTELAWLAGKEGRDEGMRVEQGAEWRLGRLRTRCDAILCYAACEWEGM